MDPAAHTPENHPSLICAFRSCPVVLLSALVTAGCTTGMAPLTPAEVAPITSAGLSPIASTSATEWVGRHQPSHPVRYELRWLVRTERGRTRGRATVLIAPPDSLRFDYRAPFGRRGSGVIIGNHIVWSQPEEDVERFIPSPALFRGALGIPRLPPQGASISGRTRPEDQVMRYTMGDTTLTYVRAAFSSPTLTAQLLVGGRLVGTSFVTLADSTGPPLNGRVRFQESGVFFGFTVRTIDTLLSVDAGVWREPKSER